MRTWRASPCAASSSGTRHPHRARRSWCLNGGLAVHASATSARSASGTSSTSTAPPTPVPPHPASLASRAPTSRSCTATNGFREVAGERAGSLGGAPRAPRAEPAHQAADAWRGPGAVDRPAPAAGRAKPHSPGIAARWWHIDPKNGDVLALVSLPGFDPNAVRARHHRAASTARSTTTSIDPLFNRALRGAYPPGSTIKPGIAARRPHLSRGGSAGAQVLRRLLPPARQLARMFREWPATKSTATWICDDAIARFLRCLLLRSRGRASAWTASPTFLAPFGFGRPRGIDISGEKSGILPSPE